MEYLFGRSKTPKEIVREHQRVIRKSMRDVDRERTALQNQEKKLTLEIKKMAKQGQMGAARIMAKDLVRTRNQVQKFYRLHSQLQAVSLRMQTLQSTQAMAEAMRGVAKAMYSMNRQMNLPAMQRVLMEFEKQTEKMELKSEMMNDTIDDVMEGDNDEQESDEIINQVLDEIGISLTSQLADTPLAAAPQAAAASSSSTPVQKVAQPAEADLELQARLDKLKKS